MTHTALIRFAPVFTHERFIDPAWARPGRTLYERGGLRFQPGKDSVPLLVDHDKAREIGTVSHIGTIEWTDGPWIYASATVDDAPSWLERGTPASFGFCSLHTRDVHIRECRAEVVAGALVTEVSVLSPLEKPAEPCARVGLFERKKPPPAVVRTTSRTAAGGQDDYRPPLWDELERFVGYRVTDENFERALMQAQRSSLDKHYDDLAAARRTEQRVIVRHGVGKVLAVGGVPVK